MDEDTKRLIGLIVEDCIADHTMAMRIEFRDLGLAYVEQRKQDRQRREEQKLPQSDYEGYNSRLWLNEAMILKRHAENFIYALGAAIRSKTQQRDGGDLFADGARLFLSNLDVYFQGRFDRRRPFTWGGRGLPLPDFWANERPALDRKIEIERLQFRAPAAADTKSPAPSPAVRIQPSASDLEAWARKVGNTPRVELTRDYLRQTWSHERPEVYPTIKEATRVLDSVYGKRDRGRARKSNRN